MVAQDYNPSTRRLEKEEQLVLHNKTLPPKMKTKEKTTTTNKAGKSNPMCLKYSSEIHFLSLCQFENALPLHTPHQSEAT